MKETNYSLIITDLEKRILIQGLTLLKNKQINEKKLKKTQSKQKYKKKN